MAGPGHDGAYYDVVRACMAEGRQPRPGEIEQVALRIWRDAFGRAADGEGRDAAIRSTDYRRARSAAMKALEICDLQV